MPEISQQELLRSLPQVEEVLHHPSLEALQDTLPRALVTDFVRDAISNARAGILAGTTTAVDSEAIAADARNRALLLEQPSLRGVINASGVIIHTNLGRSVLPDAAVQAVVDVARGYSTLEYNPRTMSRGSRHDHCESLICTLTGAEAAIAVNNNAAAVMMVLTEFAAGHEAIVSRGELVEIGGSFRVPDVMRMSNATMVEVGTTNKTHLFDYENALTDNTAMLLKVHPSNYRLTGFTESVPIKDLRALADRTSTEQEVLVYEDQGSGALVRLDCFGEYAEPAVVESLKQGADLVSFSGDKLLGGPQAGIIVGSKQLIDRLKKNPLARALRLDKMTLAALEATLRIYLDKERALREIPTLAMLSAPAEDVRVRAEALLSALNEAIPAGCATLSIVPEIARAGGGALPMCDIDTFAVCVEFQQGDAQSCEHHLIAERSIPVIARIKKDTVLCDARTIRNKEEIAEIARAFAEYFAG